MDLERGSVLLVDDDPDDRLLASMCWARAGIRNPIVLAEDGQKAIDYLGAREISALPALVLLDLKMPVRDGFEVLAWIRANGACRLLPVVVLTASSLPCDVRRAYEHGANAFVVKPGSVEDLVELLQGVQAFWLRFNVRWERVGGATTFANFP